MAASMKVFLCTLISFIIIFDNISEFEAFKLIGNINRNAKNNTDNIKNNNLNLKLKLQNLTYSNSPSYSLEKYYVFGERIAGDNRVGEFKDKLTFSSATDKEISLKFPNIEGKHFRVSQVRIYVDQSTNQGSAHITEGGIDETFIELLIKASQTMWLGYLVECYGY